MALTLFPRMAICFYSIWPVDYWCSRNNLNKWADQGDILTLTKKINGGTLGLEDRIKHYNHALHVIGG